MACARRDKRCDRLGCSSGLGTQNMLQSLRSDVRGQDPRTDHSNFFFFYDQNRAALHHGQCVKTGRGGGREGRGREVQCGCRASARDSRWQATSRGRWPLRARPGALAPRPLRQPACASRPPRGQGARQAVCRRACVRAFVRACVRACAYGRVRVRV